MLSPNEITAVVLAGGYGTRVRHLLPGVPKPMAAAAGRPFLEWVVRYLARQGIVEIVLSTGHLAEVVERHFASQPVNGVEVRCVAEPAPMGTAGGFLRAVRLSGQTPKAWLVLNGDSLVFADLSPVVSALEEPMADGGPPPQGVILGLDMEDASRFGALAIGPTGALQGFVEKRPGPGVINAGVYLLRPTLLEAFPRDRLPLSFETEVFPTLTSGRDCLRVRVVKAPFLDIGTPQTLSQAESFIRQNLGEFSLA